MNGQLHTIKHTEIPSLTMFTTNLSCSATSLEFPHDSAGYAFVQFGLAFSQWNVVLGFASFVQDHSSSKS